MFFLGIDVSKATLDVCLLGENASLSATFDNTPKGWRSLMNWLNKRLKGQAAHVCLEATGHYGEGVTSYLHQHAFSVSVVNPARIKGYATSRLARNKTDPGDAALIADFCRAQHDTLPLWMPPDPAQQHLQSLVRQLDDLDKMRQQERNRLQAGETSPTVLERIRQHITFLDQHIQVVKDEMKDHINRHPHLKRQRDLLASITGIAELTAAKLLGEIRAIADFGSPHQLVAFAGLNPRQHRSGTSIRGKTRISKQGNAALRAALFMPAVSAKNTNPLMRPLVERLTQRGHCKMSIVVAVMRKLLHLVFGILKSGQPFDPHYLDNRAAFA